MDVVTSIKELRQRINRAPRPIGLVPTMGALHEGHLSLVRRARADSATVVATIFVNPTQFGPTEDLTRYPRDLEADLKLLEDNGVDVAFCPSTDKVYPQGFATTVEVRGPALPLEGEARPDHFRGVATVVTKLLLMSAPDVAYFGQKDAQQAAVIKQLVADLDIPVHVEVCPTVREPDGLAMSSRNAYLSAEQRAAAPVIFGALSAVQTLYESGELSRQTLERRCREMLEAEPLIEAIDYVAVVDSGSFIQAADLLGVQPVTLVVAARIGGTRLIDNVVLKPEAG
ncbi:MAG: pantoate--beta-alanine ligase [Chloroflexi bacterium]|nr:pantoate--beta-alanine ligase [Chloroflexota bacterium]